MPGLTCLSLFSGCGGLDLGLRRAGFKVVLAVENDKHAAESHRLNFPGTILLEESVTDVLTRDLDVILSGESEIDLLAGGPPCPPFSKSRFYRKDAPRALADPNGLETISGYLEFVERLKPRAFLLENVPGLAYAVHGEALIHILDRVHSAGYKTDWRILNAADYGVPQTRERFFLAGWREGNFTWPTPTHAEDPSGDLLSMSSLPWRTAGDAIGDLDTEDRACDDGHVAGGKHHDLLEQVPPGDNYLFFTEKRGYPNPLFKWRSRYWSFLLKLSPDRPSWTIQARRSNNMGPFHWRNRILRIDEVMRLQTFPDDWQLVGTAERQWRQVGNAVPSLLAEHLGKALAAAIRESRRGAEIGTTSE